MMLIWWRNGRNYPNNISPPMADGIHCKEKNKAGQREFKGEGWV